MSQRDHAIQRALERYGVILTHDDINRLEAQITSGQAMVAKHLGQGTTLYFVRQGPIGMIACWGPTNCAGSVGRHIITFYPAGCLTTSGKREWAAKQGKMRKRPRRNPRAFREVQLES